MKRIFTAAICLLFIGHAFSQTRLFHQTINQTDVPSSMRLQQNDARHYLGTRYVKQSLALAEQDYMITLNDQLTILSSFKKMHRYDAGSYSYEGIIMGANPGHVVLSSYADRIAGMITLDDGRRFMIDQQADGIFAISQTAEAAFAEQEKPGDYVEWKDATTGIATLANADICNVANTCPAPSVIDLMIVYTQQAETAWGGQANTVANLTTAVTNMTTSMTNSGINNVTFRLVHTVKVDYTESGDFGTDLNRLQGTTDTYMDNIHALRDQYGADMVSLIIGSPTSSCGIGYLNTSSTNYSASSGFNVSLYSCVVGNYTMAHEFGHNMGLRHDYYVDGSTSPCAHMHGYINQKAIQLGAASTSAQRWRTIMAYNDQCSVVGGFNCTRLNRWSNPLQLYNGDSIGRVIGSTQPADEAYAFYRMACVVASFRATANGCPTPGGLTTTNIAATSATLGWAAAAGAQSYTVEYKTSSAATWTAAATATTATSVNLTGLTAGTTYNWRVLTNCSSGASSYATLTFATNPLCGIPTGLNAGSITATSASLSWSSVVSASTYDVEFKASTATTWTPLATATASTSVNVTGLVSGVTYNWQVRATCVEGSGAWATANFTTLVVACTDVYETNNTRTAAKVITPSTDLIGLINPSNDNDYFKFSNAAGIQNIRVTLTNLPANYNIELYRTGTNKRVAISANSGTANETITLNNAAVSQYEVRVYGNNRNEFNGIQCYTLRVDISSTAFDQADNDKADWQMVAPGGVTVYPVPAKGLLNVAFDAAENGRTEISLMNQLGVSLRQKAIAAMKGTNFTTMDISNMPQGMYILKVAQGKTVRTAKVIVLE